MHSCLHAWGWMPPSGPNDALRQQVTASLQVDVDPAEMFAQLQEMEKKHSAELARLKKEYEAQIEELEEALEEARAAGAAG